MNLKSKNGLLGEYTLSKERIDFSGKVYRYFLEFKVNKNEIKISYLKNDSGSNKKIYCFPGILTNSLYFLPLLEHYNYSVIAFDDFNQGKSKGFPEGHTILDSAKIIEFVSSVEGTADVLIGNSLGGYVVSEYFKKNSEKVKGLIMSNTAVDLDQLSEQLKMVFQNPEIALGFLQMSRQQAGPLIQSFFNSKLEEKFFEELIKSFKEIPDSENKTFYNSIIYGNEGKIQKLINGALSKNKEKVFVFYGENDQHIALLPAESNVYVCLLKENFYMVKGSGHVIPYDKPEAFEKVLKSLLG